MSSNMPGCLDLKSSETASAMDLDDAENWVLKGEGNANVVFSYEGSLPHLRGSVIRVEKSKRFLSRKLSSELYDLEALVWSAVPGLSASESIFRKTRYVEDVMMKLLGENYVFPQVVVAAAPSFVQELVRRCRREAVTNITGRLVAVQPDHTVFADGLVNEPTICVELKPKCGFVPTSTAIASDNVLKLKLCRFRLHQHYKLAKGKISRISKYDPCELFSRDPERIQEALWTLLDDPQNNFTLFRNGVSVYYGKDTKTELSDHLGKSIDGLFAPAEADHRGLFVRLLERILSREGVLQRLLKVQQLDAYDIEAVHPLFCHVLKTVAHLPRLPSEFLHRQSSISDGRRASSDLSRGTSLSKNAHRIDHELEDRNLVKRQRTAGASSHGNATCPSDTEGTLQGREEASPSDAWSEDSQVSENLSLTDAILSVEGPDASRSSSAWVTRKATLNSLLNLPNEHACEILRSYLMAATAKDCGIMVTFQRVQTTGELPFELAERNIPSRGSFGVLHDSQTGDWFRYKVAFVDLDLKPVAKIVSHFELDQNIMKYASAALQSDMAGCEPHDR